MNALAKIVAFAAALAVIFAGAALAGSVIDPDTDDGSSVADDSHGHGMASRSAAPDAADPVRGLAVAAHGLRLVVDDPDLRRGAVEALRFRVVDEQGAAVRDFDVEHAKRMHLILARRDLSGFQHLHPTMAADGTWSTPVRLPAAGSYRLFADFSHGAEATTLATDLRVDGAAELRPLPRPATSATTDGGYRVGLDAGRVRRGAEAELRFTVTRDGRPVHVEPYLGADGHLVALRDGDLAFLHVHPSGHANDGGGAHDDAIAFEATFPSDGRYRLFLQFKHEGAVRTVGFTEEVG